MHINISISPSRICRVIREETKLDKKIKKKKKKRTQIAVVKVGVGTQTRKREMVKEINF